MSYEKFEAQPYSISYDLEGFINELRRIFNSEGKAPSKLRRLKRVVDEAEKYAIECGHLPRKRAIKK